MKNIFLVILVACSSEVYGQFNSKIGYSAWLHSMNNVDALYNSFSDDRPWLADRITGFNFTNSLELGVKYRVDRLTFELGIISGQGESKGVGINAGMNEEFRWKVSHFDYHLNVIQHFAGWGIGAGLANQRLRLREFNDISSKFVDITNQRQLAARIFVQVEVPSRTVSFCLRPFYQFGLDDYDISPVANTLGVNGENSQNLRIIGLSMLFFNGPQS